MFQPVELAYHQIRELQEMLGRAHKLHAPSYDAYAFQLQMNRLDQPSNPEPFRALCPYHRDEPGLPRCSSHYQVHFLHTPAYFSSAVSNRLHPIQDSNPKAHR